MGVPVGLLAGGWVFWSLDRMYGYTQPCLGGYEPFIAFALEAPFHGQTFVIELERSNQLKSGRETQHTECSFCSNQKKGDDCLLKIGSST